MNENIRAVGTMFLGAAMALFIIGMWLPMPKETKGDILIAMIICLFVSGVFAFIYDLPNIKHSTNGKR